MSLPTARPITRPSLIDPSAGFGMLGSMTTSGRCAAINVRPIGLSAGIRSRLPQAGHTWWRLLMRQIEYMRPGTIKNKYSTTSIQIEPGVSLIGSPTAPQRWQRFCMVYAFRLAIRLFSACVHEFAHLADVLLNIRYGFVLSVSAGVIDACIGGSVYVWIPAIV